MKDEKLATGARIQTVDTLNYALAVGNEGFAIVLPGGVVSRKSIAREGDVYLVTHHIDDSEQVLSKEQLMDADCTNIGKAMKHGTFVTFG